MRIILGAVFIALLAACAPADDGDTDIASCDARATAQWRGGSAEFSVEGTTSGPDCQRAVATLVVRDASGTPLYTEAFLTEHVMVLAPAHDLDSMRTALNEWVSYDNHTMATTSALPDWPANAQGPQNGEFPFYPDESFDRERYMALRAQDLPLLCYVQGMESMGCLALDHGAFEKAGVQAFPG